jgi:hypothetical protein
MATARISQEISSASALMGTMEMLLFQMDAKVVIALQLINMGFPIN